MQFTKKQLQAVAAAASTDETRYNLCGVRFDGSLIVATDGHRLHTIEDLGDCGGAFTIELADIKRLIQAMGPKSVCEVHYNVDVPFVAFVVDGARFEFKPIEGKFCDYRQVIPKDEPSNPAAFTVNARYLMAACDAAIKAGGTTAGLGGKRDPVILIQPGDYCAPIRITSGDLLTVVMPMRSKVGDERAEAERKALAA